MLFGLLPLLLWSFASLVALLALIQVLVELGLLVSQHTFSFPACLGLQCCFWFGCVLLASMHFSVVAISISWLEWSWHHWQGGRQCQALAAVELLNREGKDGQRPAAASPRLLFVATVMLNFVGDWCCRLHWTGQCGLLKQG